MTTTRPIPPLTALTDREAAILDAWLETRSVRATAERTGTHRNTVTLVLDRYKNALRQVVQQAKEGENCANGTLSGQGV